MFAVPGSKLWPAVWQYHEMRYDSAHAAVAAGTAEAALCHAAVRVRTFVAQNHATIEACEKGKYTYEYSFVLAYCNTTKKYTLCICTYVHIYYIRYAYFAAEKLSEVRNMYSFVWT